MQATTDIYKYLSGSKQISSAIYLRVIYLITFSHHKCYWFKAS